jgi:hypothetical protein
MFVDPLHPATRQSSPALVHPAGHKQRTPIQIQIKWAATVLRRRTADG